MQLRHRVALDGIELDSIDERIMIQKVETADGKESVSTVDLFGVGSGSRVTNIHRSSLDITVKFTLRLRKTAMAEREEILERINAWAYAGGWLTTNYKENRQIRVFRAQAAGAGDPWNWTREYSIIFRACGVPYWQERNPEMVTVRNVSSRSIAFGVNGSEKSVLGIQFQNTSGGTINSFTISTGIAEIKLRNLGLANGQTLEIDRRDDGRRCVLFIRKGSGSSWQSAMDKRTTDSSNDLFVEPGTQTITFSADGNGTLSISCCGRFA